MKVIACHAARLRVAEMQRLYRQRGPHALPRSNIRHIWNLDGPNASASQFKPENRRGQANFNGHRVEQEQTDIEVNLAGIGGVVLAQALLSHGRGVVSPMPNFSTSPFWNRKLRLAVLTLATFIALC